MLFSLLRAVDARRERYYHEALCSAMRQRYDALCYFARCAMPRVIDDAVCHATYELCMRPPVYAATARRYA